MVDLVPPDHVTLAEVARQAGVGIATASRALRNTPGVAAATRVKVREVAARLSYVASPEALRLATWTTSRVALVVPHLDRWFFGAIVAGLESVLRDADLDVLLYHVGDADDRRRFFEQLPARRKVDAAVIVAYPVDDREYQRLALMGVHIVAAGGKSGDYPYVCINDRAAGAQAINHLVNLGHRRIAMITVDDPQQPLVTERSRAYYECLEAADIPIDPELVQTSDWGGEQAAASMAALLSLRSPPTAVYAYSDEIAVGALRTLRRSGLRVPEDMSIVGTDDHPLAALTDLTTVRQPVHLQGQLAGQMLLGLLRGQDVDVAVEVPTELVVRASTAPQRR
jgi:LacI family transcriptional regulator, repressor for deo operon, udp, cdd, tsx, nupC, and nupG